MNSPEFYEHIKKDFSSENITKASAESQRSHAESHEKRHGIKSLPFIRGLR